MSWKRVCSESAPVIVALGVCVGVFCLYVRAWHVGYRADALALLGSHFLKALLIVVAGVTVIIGLQGEHDLTLLIIEHVMRALMRIADRILVLHHGEMIAHGTPSEIANDQGVLDCYLGATV